jgi:hypothetical protein
MGKGERHDGDGQEIEPERHDRPGGRGFTANGQERAHERPPSFAGSLAASPHTEQIKGLERSKRRATAQTGSQSRQVRKSRGKWELKFSTNL